MGVFTKEDLMRFQAESLDDKFQRTLAKVSEWYSRWGNEVYVSFSGGKDSTVLADICARWCKIINKPLYLVFVDTGLEYPEIRQHVKFFAQWLRDTYGIEVVLEILRPKMRFDEVIKKHGYPIISKAVANAVQTTRHKIRFGGNMESVRVKQLLGTYEGARNDGKKSKFDKSRYKPLLDVDFDISDMCCGVMKKAPLKEWEKKNKKYPIVATMADESIQREAEWLKTGCNGFDMKRPTSKPMSFWTEQDVLQYVKREQIPLASVYGDIVYAENPEQMRIEDFGLAECGTERLKTTGCERTGCIFCGFGCHLDKKEPTRFQQLAETHPRQYEYCIGGGQYDENGLWQPNKKGLGLGHVFDELNAIYGDDFIKYKGAENERF